MESSDQHFRFANLLAGPAAQKDTAFVEWETPILTRNLYSGQEVFANSLFTGYTRRLGQLNGEKIQHFRSLLTRLQKICEPYKTPIEWRGGELIMVDNTKMMHGRESFEQSPDTVRHVRTRYGLSCNA